MGRNTINLMQEFKNYTQKNCQKNRTENQAKMLESPMQRAPESLPLTETQERHLTKPSEANTGEQAPSVLCIRCFDGLIGTHGEASILRLPASHMLPVSHMSFLREEMNNLPSTEVKVIPKPK